MKNVKEDSISKQRRLLMGLRSSLVGKEHTLPFTIYNDETIELLLQAQPQSLEELSQVKGFPKDGKRVKGFGESIVKIFTDTNNIAEVKFSADCKSVMVSSMSFF